MLDGVDLRLKSLYRVFGLALHALLRQYRAVVDFLVNYVDGDASLRHACVPCVLYAVRAWEERQERGVYVDYASSETAHEIRREYAHEAGEDDPVRAGLFNRESYRFFGVGLAELLV